MVALGDPSFAVANGKPQSQTPLNTPSMAALGSAPKALALTLKLCTWPQLVVEKMLAGEGTSRKAIGREAFTERVWEWKAQYGGAITGQLRRLGASCDWSRERFTLDDGLSGGGPCLF